jgi:hypothetical protein
MSEEMSGGLPAWVTGWLSHARLAPYVAAAGPSGALELYAWNCRVSTVLFELIGWFEVAWRNNIDQAICAGRRAGARHWLFDQTFPLQPRTWDKVAVAARNVGSRTRQPTSGQLIAELTLGFWRFTASGYRQTIWMNYLSHAFPHAPRRPQAAQMDRQLDGIIKLRNRIAHHEPIGRSAAVHRTVEDMLAIGSWISPVMARWWRERTTVRLVLADRPWRDF